MQSFELIRNFLYLSGAEVASKLVTFVAITYLARVAGPVGFGYVEFAGAVLVCASLIVDQGFGTYGAREIAREPSRSSSLVAEVVVARAGLALVAYAAVAIFALALNRSSILTQLLLIYGLSLLATPLLLQWVFQGHNQMRTVAGLQLLRQTIVAVVIFALVSEPSRVWGAAVAEVAGACVVAGYSLWLYVGRFRQSIRWQWSISRRLFREGVPIGLSQMLWMVRMSGATVIVGIIASAQDVGFFGAAMRILIGLHAFVWLYYFNLLPSMSRAWNTGQHSFGRLVKGSLHSVAWVAVVVGIVWMLVAPSVTTIVYGTAFALAAGPLQWLAGVWVAAALSGHYRFGLIAAGHQNAEMIISGIGAFAALVLIPVGYTKGGPSGAAIGLLATELLVWWSAWWWANRQLGLTGHTRFLVRPFLAVVLILTLLPLVSSIPQIERAGLAGGLVVLLALALDREARERCQEIATSWRPWTAQRVDETVREAIR